MNSVSTVMKRAPARPWQQASSSAVVEIMVMGRDHYTEWGAVEGHRPPGPMTGPHRCSREIHFTTAARTSIVVGCPASSWPWFSFSRRPRRPLRGRALDDSVKVSLAALDRLAGTPLPKLDGKVVVAFWASWCPPCLVEFRDLARLHTAFAGRGLVIVAVNRFEEWNADENPRRMIRFLTAPCRHSRWSMATVPLPGPSAGLTASRRFRLRSHRRACLLVRPSARGDETIGGP